MASQASIVEAIRRILREDPRVGILLAEILGPPPALGESARPWEH